MCNASIPFLFLTLTATLTSPVFAARTFTLLEPVPAPKIAASAVAYPGGRHNVGNIVDGNVRTEYSSDGKGTNTFIEFDFGQPIPIAAFRHVDRNDPATIATSELRFLDPNGSEIANISITHVNQRGGTTFKILPQPVTVQRVRWQVTALGSGLGTVGGAEITFFRVGKSEPSPTQVTLEAKPLSLLLRDGAALTQPIKVTVDYPYAEPVEAIVRAAGIPSQTVQLTPGSRSLDLSMPAVESPRAIRLEAVIAGTAVAAREIAVKPVRKFEIFLLPHSHNDIGYTALQADVVKKQDSNIETGLRLAKETANYPEGARFVWNTEVLWCVDNYLREATPDQRTEFMAAVKAGQIGLDAFYCNILTGLCRPEELINLMGYATRLSAQTGVPIESAMISDVPGYTWSTVSAMAQAGVKYFSFAPNYFDRMGGTMKEWQNKPFWWQGPDGRSRVLCWCPSRGYALGHLIGDGPALARFIPDYLTELETNSYPYDITYLRWNVHGDNGSPDEKLAGVVRDWNEHYAWPRLIISTTANAFRQFERRYGSKLPVFSGDYTPYWEDGAASSAFETALNRASGERLVQAETLWALRKPGPFPTVAFQETWRDILLYSEHTWGAHNSISQPDLPFVREQWKVKQSFALDADKESRELLESAGASSSQNSNAGAIDVFNTSSWPRTDLVTVPPAEAGTSGSLVVDDADRPVAAQRLAGGELVFLASNVPALGSRRYRIKPGLCPVRGSLKAEGSALSSADFTIRIDETSGAIKSLYNRALQKELVDPAAATALNDFFYLPGSNVKGVERNGPVKITVEESGPLIASLMVESSAPGCKRLAREVRLIEGLDRVELINTIEKLPVRAKEGLHFGYGFNVPQGQVRMDVGFAVVRPELDQIPASCKNWFSVQRWVDISNDKFGVTWSPLDAPLVELGGLTANLIGSQNDWRVWIQHLKPTQTIYSWVMNNHWHTNYRAEQDGTVIFRYAIRAHRNFSAEDAARFGEGCSQPLLAVRASAGPASKPRLSVNSDKVVLSAFKPSDDGKGWIVRLFGASGKNSKVKLTWANPIPQQIWLSDTSEQPKAKVGNSVEVPAWGIVTLRAE